MKLKYELNIVKMEDETIAVPLSNNPDNDFKGVLRMNESTESIINLLREDTTVDEVVAKLKQEYTADEDVLRKNVNKVIDILKSNDLIIE